MKYVIFQSLELRLSLVLAMDVVSKGKVALIIVNWEYDGFSNLEFPESDGKMMKQMMDHSEYDRVTVVKNSENILTAIENFVETMNFEALERFHFHYSGKKD